MSTVPTTPPSAAEAAFAALTETEERIAQCAPDRITACRRRLDPRSRASIEAYGAEAARDASRFADTLLDQALSRDLGPMHERLKELKQIAGGLDPKGLAGDGIIARVFSDAGREISKFTERFHTVRQQIDAVAYRIEDDIENIRGGLVALDHLFDLQRDQFIDLIAHIAAGHAELARWRQELIPAATAAAAADPDAPDARLREQDARDLARNADLLDRKIAALEKSKSIAFLLMPTIRATQETGQGVMEEMRMALDHAIPAWKAGMAVAIEQAKQRRGLKGLDAFSAFTERVIRQITQDVGANAEQLHERAVRGIAGADEITRGIAMLGAAFDRIDQLREQERLAIQRGRATLVAGQRDLEQTRLRLAS